LIFLNTNVLAETLRKSPNPTVIAWLVRHDTERGLPIVTIAEIAFGTCPPIRGSDPIGVNMHPGAVMPEAAASGCPGSTTTGSGKVCTGSGRGFRARAARAPE
jgi:hypothetical protein